MVSSHRLVGLVQHRHVTAPGRLTRRRRWAAMALSAAVAVALAGCGSSVGGPSDSASGGADDGAGALRFGVITPATGVASSAGLAQQAGFEMAVEELNAAGGVNGQPITFDAQDDAGDPATSTQLARRFAQDDTYDVLFGTITGDTAAAVTPVAEQAGMPFVTAILGDPSTCSTVAWPFGQTNRMLITLQLQNLVAQHGPRIAFVGSDYNFPHDYAAAVEELAPAAGAEVVAQEFSPLGTTDFEPTIGRLAATQPDAVLSMVVGADAVAFTQQAAAFGLLTPELGYEGAPLDADYFPAVAEQVSGRAHVVRWADGVEDPDSAAFVTRYHARVGNELPVPEVAASAYFATMFVAAAVEDSGATSREEINAAIGSFSYDSPLGQGTRFSSDGTRNVFLADMLHATAQAGGYVVTSNAGVVEDTTTSCR